MTLADRLVVSLAPLFGRVRRDVTAVKRQGAQAWTREPLTLPALLAHVNGTTVRGVSQILPGESTTRVAILDLDSHGGETPWRAMVDVAERLMVTLQLFGGEPVPWRSSGGRGIHLYLLWDEPQDAYSVRCWLREVLAASGLKNGTKGVAQGQCEVFPKQDSVPADGFGNQVVLPLAGASVPLVWEELVGEWLPGQRDDALNVEWRASDPVPHADKPERVAARVSLGGSSPEGYVELQKLLDAIPNLGADALDYDEWWRVVAAIHHETDGSPIGLELAHEFSGKSDKYEPAFLDERVWPFIRSEGRGAVIGLGTLQHIAARYGWVSVPVDVDAFDDVSELDPRPPVADLGVSTGFEVDDGQRAARLAHASRNLEDRRGAGAAWQPPLGERTLREGERREEVAQMNGNHTPELLPRPPAIPPPPARVADNVKRRGIPEAHYLTTDQANANRLAKAFGSHVFVAADHWHVWDGKRWKMDDADVNRYGCQLSDLIRAEAVEIKARASANPDPAAIRKAAEIAEALLKWAQKSEMAGTINAALGLVRKMLTVDAGQLDRDPWLLNVANGTVDLRTGDLQRHNAADYITKLVPVAYRADAVAPTWERVLREITREDGGGGAPVAAFLQRWFGYCLTGLVVEQAFVVHWGSGSNGKSTVLGLMADTLGDYAGSAPPGLMAASKGDRHPTEIASLMGRRMVTAHESADGVVLREDFVKQATGDDVLTARYMRGDFFDFPPTHKLQLLTNHKPQVKGTDPGIWRRVILVPYVASFGSVEGVAAGTHTHVRDLGMVKRLRWELEGVLAWRVRGAVEWAQGGGLAPPEVVRVASAEYRSEQDRVGQFVAECCERMPANASADEAKRWGEPLTVGGDLGAKSGLYPTYVAWCKEGGVFPLSKSRFRDDVLRVVGVSAVTVRKAPVENGRRRDLAVVPGLRLLTD